MDYVLLQILIGDLCRKPDACSSRNIIRAGAHTVLLASAKDQRADLSLITDIKEARTLRRMEFMAAHRKKINSPSSWVDSFLGI